MTSSIEVISGDLVYRVLTYPIGSSKVITFVNPFSYQILDSRSELVSDIDYIFSDGSLFCFMHNICNKQNKISRASFDYSSLAEPVFSFCENNKLRVAFVGAEESQLVLALENIKARHQNLDIVYSRNGFFKDSDEINQSLEEMALSNVDVVIVGMGTPMQEEFSIQVKNKLPEGVLIFTCGGFLTQTSIRPDYYSPIIKKLGLRWLQRFVAHEHVRSRVLNDYPRFCYLYLKQNFRIRKH